MPKVSEEHKQRRRDEILDAAQRVFARHGYEGATVARLEEETGLSRGAIFNYFGSKDELFAEVVGQSSDRLIDLWLERGYRALLDAILHEDPDWLAVQVEAGRRVRTDERFRAAMEELSERARERRPERRARLAEWVRDDVSTDAIATYLSMLANGLAFARVMGDELPDLDVLDELVRTGVAPR